MIMVPILSVYFSRKINERVSSKEIELVIITDSEHRSKKINDTTDGFFSTSFEEFDYHGTIKDCWKKKRTIIDKLRGNQKYFLVFYEALKDTKNKTPEIKPINKAKLAENTSDILMKIKRYRGVNPALDSQFKEKSGGIPNWILVIVLFAVLILGLLAAAQMGLIKLPSAIIALTMRWSL